MQRFMSLLMGLTLAVAGCGGSTTPKVDLAKSGDMATTSSNEDMDMAGTTTSNIDLAGADLAGTVTTGTDMAKATAGMGVTGAACSHPTDCAPGTLGATKQPPACLKSVALELLGTAVPALGGYCQTPCTITKNSAANNYINPECPGGEATCDQDSKCWVQCATSIDCDSLDGHTAGQYVCVAGAQTNTCVPVGESECVPGTAGACANWMADGGAKDDAGMNIDKYACSNISPDGTAGSCDLICDVFNQASCPNITIGTTSLPQACSAAPETGIASCSLPQTKLAGDSCMYLNDCSAGLGCSFFETPSGSTMAMPVCRAYCRTGANAVACTDAAAMKCVDLSTTVKSTVLGICSP